MYSISTGCSKYSAKKDNAHNQCQCSKLRNITKADILLTLLALTQYTAEQEFTLKAFMYS